MLYSSATSGNSELDAESREARLSRLSPPAILFVCLLQRSKEISRSAVASMNEAAFASIEFLLPDHSTPNRLNHIAWLSPTLPLIVSEP